MKLKPVVIAMASVALLASTSSALARDTSNPQQDMQALMLQSTVNNNHHANAYNHWFKHVRVSGNVTVDMLSSDRGLVPASAGGSGATAAARLVTTPGLRPTIFGAGSYSGIELTEAVVNVDARINRWTSAHISLLGQDNAPGFRPLFSSTFVNDAGSPAVTADEAYMTFGNFNKSPFYASLGRQYLPFGNYKRHSIVPTVTTALSELRATAAKAGFATDYGFYGSVYGFQNTARQVTAGSAITTATTYAGALRSPSINNWGANLAFRHTFGDYGINTGVSYLNDMHQVNTILENLAVNTAGNSIYTRRVGGAAAWFNGHMGAFSLQAAYVTALSKFNSTSVSYTNNAGASFTGAIPSAFNIEGGYSFRAFGNRYNVISLGYGLTDESAALGLPKYRYTVSYCLNMFRDSLVKFEIMQNQNYKAKYVTNGTGNRSNTIAAVRFQVFFA